MKNKTLCFLLVLCFGWLACVDRPDAVMGYYDLGTSLVKVVSIENRLDVPWEVQHFEGMLWYSLQGGTVWRIDEDGKKVPQKLLDISSVYRLRTLGALGMDVGREHDSVFVYMVYNTISDSSLIDTSTLRTRLVKYYFDESKKVLENPVTLLVWPANTGHNGSRVLLGPDNDLFVTTGDRAEDNDAQNTASLNGKVLHLMRDGSIPKNNPIANSYVWSYGHRNQQGLTFGPFGLLYASEHGDALADEVNLVVKGGNYGWPLVEGHCDTETEKKRLDSSRLDIVYPMMEWTPTIAPADIAYYGKGPISEFRNSLLLLTLKGSALHVLHLDDSGRRILKDDVFFKNTFGRLRSICVDEKGNVYLSTSNRDWNPGVGFPKDLDDHILKISNLQNGVVDSALEENARWDAGVELQDGQNVYLSYCASCHKPDGMGLEGNYPPLMGNPILRNSEKLISLLSHGRNGRQIVMGKVYDQNMPDFSFLTDVQMFKLVNYLKKTFADDDAIGEPDFKSIRKASK